MSDVRRFNDRGLQAFSDFVEQLTVDSSIRVPTSYLHDERLSEPIAELSGKRLEPQRFKTRFEAAKYLHELPNGMPTAATDAGLWSWLTLFYFDSVCPADPKTGERGPHRDRSRYILKGDFRHYYRHLLAGPYRIYCVTAQCPERAMVVVCQPLHEPGDIVEQLASRQEFITNMGILELATRLYYDSRKNKIKKGASSRDGPGGIRHFIRLLNQLDLTWDLYSLSAAELQQLLPDGFSRFLNDCAS